jgi:hypothetical protein
MLDDFAADVVRDLAEGFSSRATRGRLTPHASACPKPSGCSSTGVT